MGKIKYREKENIITVMDGDTVIAKYEVDRHWQEKNTSVKEDGIYIRLYNRMRGFQDCKVELNSDKIQKIP
jgi:hypothetical protein